MDKKNRLSAFVFPVTRLVIALAVTLLSVSCGQPVPKDAHPQQAMDLSSDSANPGSTIRYAKGFTISYNDHFKLVHIFNRSGDRTDTLEYLLLGNGQPVPEGHPRAQVIHTPVQNMILTSSMHIAEAAFAGVVDRITGLGSFDFISSPVVREAIRAGKIKQVGLDGNLNNELIISMQPGIFMASSNPEAGSGKFRTLTDAGIPVVMNAEWLESTPLGRAEWVKLFAAMTGNERLVNKKFDSVEQTYNKLAQLGRAAKERPRLIISMPYQGSWFMPAGESYMANFIRDAGGDYKWLDTKGTGSLALNFEGAAPEALQADYWLNIGTVDSKKEILAKDVRFGSFRSFITGKLYNNTKQVNDLGSNDYWESGAVSPDVVLADMISILHAELLPGHELVYYKLLH